MLAPKKILYIHHFSGMGGATMSLFYIIEKLDRIRYKPSVLFLGGEGPGVEYFRNHDIEVHVATNISWYAHAENAHYGIISRRPLRPITDLLRIPVSVNRLKKFFRHNPVDLVHLNTSVLLPAGIAARACGIKVVWHIREPLRRGFLGIRRYFVRSCIKRNADAIIAISREDADRLGESVQNLTVVYNYIDFNKFNREIDPGAIRNEFKFNENDFVVCNLGGVIHSKGPDVYLKAASKVLLKYPSIKFLLVGYPPVNRELAILKMLKRLFFKRDANRDVLRLLRKSALLKRNVIFTGIRNDIPGILTASDVLVWSATIPHFARPIVEAWAIAKPVFATDFPNSRELIEEKKNGMVFPVNDSNKLAELIIYGIENKEQMQKMGEQGYQHALKYFNAERNAEKIYEIYSYLLP